MEIAAEVIPSGGFSLLREIASSISFGSGPKYARVFLRDLLDLVGQEGCIRLRSECFYKEGPFQGKPKVNKREEGYSPAYIADLLATFDIDSFSRDILGMSYHDGFYEVYSGNCRTLMLRKMVRDLNWREKYGHIPMDIRLCHESQIEDHYAVSIAAKNPTDNQRTADPALGAYAFIDEYFPEVRSVVKDFSPLKRFVQFALLLDRSKGNLSDLSLSHFDDISGITASLLKQRQIKLENPLEVKAKTHKFSKEFLVNWVAQIKTQLTAAVPTAEKKAISSHEKWLKSDTNLLICLMMDFINKTSSPLILKPVKAASNKEEVGGLTFRNCSQALLAICRTFGSGDDKKNFTALKLAFKQVLSKNTSSVRGQGMTVLQNILGTEGFDQRIVMAVELPPKKKGRKPNNSI